MGQAGAEPSDRWRTIASMTGADAQDQVKGLFDGLSDVEVRELSIEALRRWRKRVPTGSQIQAHDPLGREVIPLLCERKNVAFSREDINTLKEPFANALHQPWMTPVVEFLCWLVRAGLALPLGIPNGNYPTMLHLTRAGERLLIASEDHPLLPGSVERVRSRCPGLPDGVVSLIVDARACLDQGLMRPAVVLMGVAYEVAIEEVSDALVQKGRIQDAEGAAKRISNIRGVIDAVLPGTTSKERDDRFAAHAAYQFADAPRRRRNDAAHTTPTYGFDDRQETEELLVSAGRHLPNLWSLR